MESGIIACINGKLVPKEEAKVSSFDFGFLYGVGLFETFRTWHGRLVGLERHLSRLVKDAANLGWQFPLTLETLTDWVLRTLEANKSLIAEGRDARVRITVTPGTVDPAKGWWDFATTEPTVVHVTPLPQDFDSRNERGWTAVLAPWRRPKDFPLWQIKATTYFANVLARRHARSQGADEALWLNTDGNLTEGTATNLFVICDGEIWTPPPEEGLLPGVARSLVIELAASLGIPVLECPIPLSTLSRVEEAFLTNAVIGLVPLTKIGDISLPSTQTSLQLRSAFFDHCFKQGQDIFEG